MNIKKRQQKSMTEIVGLAILAAITAWQFYLFVALKGVDVQGGTVHLWIALAIGSITSIGGFFFISTFGRYHRKDEVRIASEGRLKSDEKRKRNA